MKVCRVCFRNPLFLWDEAHVDSTINLCPDILLLLEYARDDLLRGNPDDRYADWSTDVSTQSLFVFLSVWFVTSLLFSVSNYGSSTKIGKAMSPATTPTMEVDRRRKRRPVMSRSI